jgi:hypothetical protein
MFFKSNACVVAGDAAYGLSTNLICPYPGENLPNYKERHNNAHSSTRMVIERCFADLKNRWLRLKCLRSELSFANKIIAACCCLHNMSIDGGDISETDRPVVQPGSGNHLLRFNNPTSKRDALANHIVIQ